MRKAQGATEYLIILAVVVVIALILIGVLGGIPGIGGGAGGRTSSAYWSSQDVAITSAALSASGTDTVVLKNNLKNSITLNGVAINAVGLTAGQTLSPGGTVSLTGAIGACTAGSGYSYGVEINYTDTTTSQAYTLNGGGQKLEGTCGN